MAVRQTGAARWFTEVTLAGPTRELESTVTVQNTDTILVQGNPDRVAVSFVNVGAFDLFMSLAFVGAPTTGIRLSANGGNMTMTVRDDFTMVTRGWHSISAGGAISVYVLETIADVLLPPEQA